MWISLMVDWKCEEGVEWGDLIDVIEICCSEVFCWLW